MGIRLNEHKSIQIYRETTKPEDALYFLEEQDFDNLDIDDRREFAKNIFPYQIYYSPKENCFHIKADYYVGLDWLVKEKRYIHVEPKLNTAVVGFFESFTEDINEEKTDEELKKLDKEAEQAINKEDVNDIKEVDVIAMLMQIMSHSDVAKHTNQLLVIDWDAPEIPITQKQDLLTPFLIVRFLNLLQDITRKGLKKSYYKVHENLRNRVKGKILVGQQIKQNIFKNRLTNTVCEYQVFGEDSVENRFLKKVFTFCTNYVENHTEYFKKEDTIYSKDENTIFWLINYIRPAFESISSEIELHELKHYKYNPFFKEYKEAIKIGQQILKRFAYTMTKTVEEKYTTPPFWIDMPRLFELYFYSQLLKNNYADYNHVHYQLKTYGNALDFLITKENQHMVVDTKYKLHYKWGKVHDDIRQVSGYARLHKVLDTIKKMDSDFDKDKLIPCLIIYPDTEQGLKNKEITLDSINAKKKPISAYHEVFKLGIQLPMI